MPLMSRAFQLCSPRAISFQLKPDLFLLSRHIQHRRKLPLFFRYRHTSTIYFCRMSTRSPSRSPREEQAPKRRKVEPGHPRFIQPYGTMASQSDTHPTTLELTESETQLRELLLAVAAYIDDTPAEKSSTSAQVPDELTKEKVVLRWTGGWVRDKLLGVGSHDIDVAINKMTGEHFGLKMLEYLQIPGNTEKHGLEQQESKKIVSGLHTIKANPEASKNLETATIKIMGIDLDLVNLRKETYNEVSRNPEMEFGTAEEDAMRRDATVNAMFYNLNTKQIEDFTRRGFEDMDAKIIRTPLEPYQTFKDDPLRVLRLIRFASRLNYTIDPETTNAMSNQQIQEALKVKIKRERVGIELEKMLKGPDPHMALELIDRFDLYQTIFTDPTRDIDYEPENKYFALAYDFVKFIRTTDQELPSAISQTLLQAPEERYLAWVSAAVMPWADAPKVPHSKPSRPPYYAAYLVAQEGFKAPNKICDVISASLNNSEDIRTVVERCSKELRLSMGKLAQSDATARDTLGVAIRRWGPTWRSQVFFSLMYEVVLGLVSKDRLLRQYVDFLNHITKQGLQEANSFKPLINGNELAKAMGVKPGPWMKDALDVVMAWQLRNPDIADSSQAIEEVKKSRKGELFSRLILKLLSLTIRPLFLQTASDTGLNTTTPTQKTWKSPGNEYVIDLLRWILELSEPEDVQIHLLAPILLKMIDDGELKWKAKACELIDLLVKAAPQDLLLNRGYKDIFSNELFRLFTYLPSLTPEEESAGLFKQIYAPLRSLASITEESILEPPNPPVSQDESGTASLVEQLTHFSLAETKDEALLDRILREGVVAPLWHIAPATRYPNLATVIVSQLDNILVDLDINSVKHLQSFLPLLGDILRDPMAPICPPLIIETAKAIQRGIACAWPVLDSPRAMEIMVWVCKAWLNCLGFERDGKDLSDVKQELREVVARVDVLLSEDDVAGTWAAERRKIFEEHIVFAELFNG